MTLSGRSRTGAFAATPSTLTQKVYLRLELALPRYISETFSFIMELLFIYNRNHLPIELLYVVTYFTMLFLLFTRIIDFHFRHRLSHCLFLFMCLKLKKTVRMGFHCVLFSGCIPHGTLHRCVRCKLHCDIKKKEHIALFSKILLTVILYID